MKNIRLSTLLLITFVFAMTISKLHAQTTLMTYNIRYDNPNDGENNWHKRKQLLLDQLLLVEPDFLGTQEALLHQLQYLDEGLEQYEFLGAGREDGKEAGEFSALFYRSDKYQVLNSGTFWLSEIPDLPSKGWDAAIKRVCTYGKFKSRETGNELWVFNTHFDHRGKLAREESVKLIIKKVSSYTNLGDKVVIMGDLNLPPESGPIQLMAKAFGDARHCDNCVTFGTEGTFNGFKVEGEATGDRIDYIFTSDNLKVEKYSVFSHLVNGKFISDHFPVYVELQLD